MIAKKPKKKKFREGIFFEISIALLMLFLISFLVISNIKISKKSAELKEKIQSLEEQIKEAEEKKKKMESGIYQAGQESYWEEKIRAEGYVKEGEQAVVVLPSEENQPAQATTSSNFSSSLLDKIKNFFNY